MGRRFCDPQVKAWIAEARAPLVARIAAQEQRFIA
jgi:hypothetical protein